ncbi:CBS domain-containing protein [Thermodesulforhabdus norvegica]|uniref:CBS domain-containing protein n=1 Tax=Thermodesulforhabdus norvegica TaxID=39841 RepID=A0A1I4QWB5_9BACT|nr:CBS domain-containing protein [Thermodesulforhabdus norvegica]SFM44374.1 CBS domain-containing protein [Thermodesulforhabdus norvegica]
MKVSDFMTRKIEWIDANASIYDAMEKLVERRIRSLIVLWQGEDKPKGVITARDIVFKVLSEGRDPRKVTVAEVACFPVICVSKDEDIHKVVNIMKELNIARVFVCDGERIIGVVALMDVMHAALVERALGG